MKTVSPTQILDTGHVFTFGVSQERMDTHTVQTGSYTLCEVCNLQLMSATQAQIHFNGRSHLRRVKQLQTRDTALKTTASECGSVGGVLPGFVSSSAMMKPFLSFNGETLSPVGLFPNFNSMDPVQKAVINHTFGVSMVTRKKQVISCNVCQLRFNSSSQAEAHYRGSRHAKKLKSQESKAKTKISSETNKSSQPTSLAPPGTQHTAEVSVSIVESAAVEPLSEQTGNSSQCTGREPHPSCPPSALPAPTTSQVVSHDAPVLLESEEEKAKKLLYCSLCKVAVNSLSQLEAHNAGSKHKTMLVARSGAGPIKAYPRPGAKLKNISTLKGSGLQNKTFHCQICDVHVNSEIQLKQHISSRRHKDRVAGKRIKPKYSPYNKTQHGILAKDLVQPTLSPSFTSLPFVPPSSLPSTLSLPPSSLPSPLPSPISVSTSSLLTASFLHTAHEPVRTSQRSILFTPY